MHFTINENIINTSCYSNMLYFSVYVCTKCHNERNNELIGTNCIYRVIRNNKKGIFATKYHNQNGKQR